MGWLEEIEELDHRSTLAERMGGTEKVARQHEFNKLTIRERIDQITDVNSFHEIGKLAGVAEYDDKGVLIDFTPANFVFGTAEIDARPVIISGDDFTVRGGSADASIAGKRNQAEAMALGLKPMLVVAWIALSVETELDAVGITALIASAFALRDLPCNVMAGAYHDHVFVPVARADEAMSVLAGLQADARAFLGAS